MSKPNRRTDDEILDVFDDLIDAIPLDDEEVNELLTEAGFDIVQLDRDTEVLISRLTKEAEDRIAEGEQSDE